MERAGEPVELAEGSGPRYGEIAAQIESIDRRAVAHGGVSAAVGD